ADMLGSGGEGGTSAATPFWAGLITQINYVFFDQNLPNLGYMTDLLYLASVIAPGSFNDVTLGNNVSSFTLDGAEYGGINPTGTGYEAQAGYDLASGLGSPNGLLLARALTEIAHSQIFYSAVPDVIDSNGTGGWTSGTAQTLLLQTTAAADATVAVHTGTDTTDASSAAHDSFAWTSQLAQQSLQADFDPDLLALFDGQTQGSLTQAIVTSGDSVSVQFNGGATVAAQANLSASFGFADFYSDAGNSVRLAQSVAVAETANGADDAAVVIRMRQVAGADLSLSFYKVDDYNGTIGGLTPDQAGYAAAAAAAAYSVLGGGTVIAGPGDGNYGQNQITGVDAGDLIAMQLTNITNGDTFWAFSQANEVAGGEHVSHLWNYGANTWGWEDLAGGGDRDFNDLVVQLDFTSTAGHGLLVA
ncbi:MAG: putative protease, partial [Reyranella sp.]|nr:putative protease [Reyranella sp.]